jgi:hypothetical protein
MARFGIIRSLCILVVFMRPSLLKAQLVLSVESGVRQEARAIGPWTSKGTVGIGLGAILMHSATDSGGAVLTLSGDLRLPVLGKGYESGADLDLVFRDMYLTFGGGLALRTQAELPTGKEAPYFLGYSAIARINVGEVGRLFVQGKYTWLPANFGGGYIDGSAPVPWESSDQRYSVGYLFDGFDLRLGYQVQYFSYTRVAANSTGLFDRRLQSLTVGVSTLFPH